MAKMQYLEIKIPSNLFSYSKIPYLQGQRLVYCSKPILRPPAPQYGLFCQRAGHGGVNLLLRRVFQEGLSAE